MRPARLSLAPLALLLGVALLAPPAHAADPAPAPIRALIIDGQNNHNWRAMTPLLVKQLEGTRRFKVDVATTPPQGSPASAWDAFKPELSGYRVIISNYNGEPWPDRIQKAVEAFVADGGGLVVVHAANNAFADWPAWNRMIGLGWRDANFGDRITVDDAGKVVRTPKGEGPGSGHGPTHAYPVVLHDPEHPITKGLPGTMQQEVDELYHGQRGPAAHMTVLATAFSDKAKGGTGTNEPLAWVIPFGKGRVFTTLLGHVNGDDTKAVESACFRALFTRGAEWAATGEVAPAPAN